MDALIRQIIRDAQTGDPAAWERIESALQRQLIELAGMPIWVVRYSHRHGTDINVFLTSEEAYEGIRSILLSYWDEDVEGPMPENIIDAVSMYNDVTEEYIDIEESRIRTMPVPDSPPG